jgi:hypothetical protein
MTYIMLFSLLVVFGLMGYIVYLDYKFEAKKKSNDWIYKDRRRE